MLLANQMMGAWQEVGPKRWLGVGGWPQKKVGCEIGEWWEVDYQKLRKVGGWPQKQVADGRLAPK